MNVDDWRSWNSAPSGKRKQLLLNKLVSDNAPLAKRFARRLLKFTSVHVDPEDVNQAALIGLMRAIEKFDPDRPTAFSTMAWYWVRAEVSRELATHQPIHWPRRAGMPYKVAAMIDQISTMYGRPADHTDFGVTPEVFGLWSQHARFTGVEDASEEMVQSPNAEEQMIAAELDARLAELLEDVDPKRVTRAQIIAIREKLNAE